MKPYSHHSKHLEFHKAYHIVYNKNIIEYKSH
jgi:hypothetical protein